MALAAGARLGPYEVVGSLGAGGMGEVYRARDPRLGRDVALKVLRRGQRRLGPPARFEHEARAVAALNHPNVLTVFDVGEREGVALRRRRSCSKARRSARLARAPSPQRQAVGTRCRSRTGLAGRARAGDRPPRPQAGEPLPHDRRASEDPGLRPRKASCRRRRERTGDGVAPTRAGAVLGTLEYMSPEQVRRAPGGPPVGHLLARGGALRAAVGEAPVPAGDDGGDADRDPRGDAAGADDSGPRRAAGGVLGSCGGAWRRTRRSASGRRTTWRWRSRRCWRRRRGRRACRRWRSAARTRGSRASRRRTRPSSSGARRRSRRSGRGCGRGGCSR